jgi:hypothetical protein
MMVPGDVLEVIGSNLGSRDLAALAAVDRFANGVLVHSMRRRRAEYLSDFRARVSRAFGMLRCQLLRSMMRQLDDIADLESGELPDMTYEAGMITMATFPVWEFRDDGFGRMFATLEIGHLDINVEIACGTTWTFEDKPERCWLGASLESVSVFGPSAVAEWRGRQHEFRTDIPLPALTESVTTETGNVFWMDPEDLLAPMPGTRVESATRGSGYSKFEDEARIVDSELCDAKTDVASQILGALETAAIPILERYRSRANNPDWLGTSYASAQPDWTDVPFPETSFGLGDDWTCATQGSGAAAVLTATRPWESGELILRYDVWRNERTLRYAIGDETATFSFVPPGMSCAASEATGDVLDLVRMFRDAGMYTLVTCVS